MSETSNHRPTRLLVADAYDAAGRTSLTEAGGTAAGELYLRALAHVAPEIEADLFRFDTEDLPLNPENYDGVVWTGSNMTIHKPNDVIRDQIALAQQAFRKQVPQHGSCWALQLAAVAAGGTCGPNPKGREFGVARGLTLTEAGTAHPMLAGRPRTFTALTTHSDMVTALPADSVLLITNDFTHVQGAAITHDGGTFWAVQYHPEYDLHEVARIVDLRRQMLIDQGSFRDDEEVDDYVEAFEELQHTPGRADLADRYGIDSALMSRDTRLTELRNWLDHQVRPKAAAA